MLFLEKIKQCFQYYRNDDFSILAEYGDLSKYNYDQMTNILIKWNKNLSEGVNYFDAEWEDETSRIKIRYHKITKYYIQIIEEEWKPFKLIMKRKLR
jgi:hypothetical protein